MKQDSRTDKELVAGCLSGNAACWDVLVTRYQGLIYGIAISMGMCEQDAGDIFQNTCIKFYEHLGTLRDATRLSSWLAQIARQEVWKVWRCRRDVYIEDNPALAELEDARNPAPLDNLLELEKKLITREGLEQLAPECRQLLLGLYGTDPPMTYEALAAQLGMPVGSIGPKRARCLERLRKILADFGC